MTKWQEVRLGDVCDVKGGKRLPKGVNLVTIKNTHPYIRVRDLGQGKRLQLNQNYEYVDDETQKIISHYIVSEDDVLISIVGTIGLIGIVGNSLNNANLTENCVKLINLRGIDKDFLYYFLISNSGQDAIKQGTVGAVQAKLPIKNIQTIQILLPPLDIQKKIAGVLGALDDKIELNNRINNNLEQQAQALFKQYFPDIISGNKTIGDYLSPKRGKNLLSKDAVIGVVPVIAGGLSPATYHNRANTAAPVITISASGANAGYVNLWHIPVWSSDSSFIDTSITPYVYFWYIVLKIRQQEIFEAQTGSAQPHIYPQHIENMPIKEINLGLVKKYNEDATPLYMLIGHNQQENTRLVALRDALLPKLMSGEIDVSNVDISALTSTDKSSFTEE